MSWVAASVAGLIGAELEQQKRRNMSASSSRSSCYTSANYLSEKTALENPQTIAAIEQAERIKRAEAEAKDFWKKNEGNAYKIKN